jgi:hypothetical protein
MSAHPNMGGYHLYDLLTRIVPGAVIVVVFVYLSDWPLKYLQNMSPVTLATVTIVSLIIGEAIDLLRVRLYPVPKSFRRMIYAETANTAVLSWSDRMRIRIPYLSIPIETRVMEFEDDIIRRCQATFSADFSDLDEYLMYRLIVSKTEPKFTRRLTRYRTTYTFFVNSMIALVSGVFLTSSVLFNAGYSDLISVLVVLLLLFLIIGYLLGYFAEIGRIYVDLLTIEFMEITTTEGGEA